jgi:hypothetical protein
MAFPYPTVILDADFALKIGRYESVNVIIDMIPKRVKDQLDVVSTVAR